MDLQQLLQLGTSGAIDLRDFLGAMIGSVVASVAAYWMYNTYYGRTHLGAGVHRVFLLGGPAITALFVAIQFSLPLSLGLLGALSFVRFRTPVKDPAEIGFLLLVIAAAIGFATFNYWLVVALYAIAFAVLEGQRQLQRYLPGQARTYLVVSVEDPEAGVREADITSVITERLRGARLETFSTFDGRVSFHYQFTRTRDLNWSELKRELDARIAPSTTQIYMG